MTKEELLRTGYFIDNSYLDDYVELTSKHAEVAYTERHHILPRAYYNLENIEVDNSADNLVRLSFADHCKAHWLLYFCTIDKLKYATQTAFVIMVNGLTKRLKDYTETDFKVIQELKDRLLADSDIFWSVEEDNFLKQNFLAFTDEELALKLNRTAIAVQARRTHLHLPRLKMSDYSDEEIEYLIANRGHKEIKEIAAYLGRPSGSVTAKCLRLGLKQWSADPWTEEELEFLRKNSATMSTAEIAVALDRGICGVQRQCRLHKIKCVNKRPGLWTESELLYLEANYIGKTCRQMAEELDRPISSVRHKCLDLGLIKVQNSRK